MSSENTAKENLEMEEILTREREEAQMLKASISEFMHLVDVFQDLCIIYHNLERRVLQCDYVTKKMDLERMTQIENQCAMYIVAIKESKRQLDSHVVIEEELEDQIITMSKRILDACD